MSEKVKVSVILPSYNVGQYIDECLQSVVNQTLLDIEIICVDADSVDGTKEIIGSYLSDSRVKLVTSQKKSYGYQVNLGMSLAHGEYVSVVETDDFIAADMLEKLYSIAKKEDADIVKCGYYAFITGLDGKYLTNEVSLDRDGIISGGPFSFIDYCNKSQETDPFIWNAIYKRNFLLDNAISLNESPGAAFQDCGFRYQVYAYVNRAIYVDNAYYYYRRDNDSSSMFNPKGLVFNYNECSFLADKMQLAINGDNLKAHFIAENIIATMLTSYRFCLLNHIKDEMLAETMNNFRNLIKQMLDSKALILDDLSENMKNEVLLLMDSYEKYASFVEEKLSDLDKNATDFIENIKKANGIVVFGSGRIGKSVYTWLVKNKICSDLSVCDNNPELWGNTFFDTTVRVPEDAMISNSKVFVLAAGKHNCEIKKQLVDSGIGEDRIVEYLYATHPLLCTGTMMDIFYLS